MLVDSGDQPFGGCLPAKTFRRSGLGKPVAAKGLSMVLLDRCDDLTNETPVAGSRHQFVLDRSIDESRVDEATYQDQRSCLLIFTSALFFCHGSSNCDGKNTQLVGQCQGNKCKLSAL